MKRETAAARGYGHQWQKARAGYLLKHPFCVMCARLGTTSLAKVVDHIVPHRGDRVLFWDKTNWQPLCIDHHNGAKQSDEKLGQQKGSTIDGRPIDPSHPWNRTK